MRPEDEPVEETAVQDGVDPALAGQGDEHDLADAYASAAHVGTIIMSGGQQIGADLPEDEDDGALKPLPERLVMELTAHRTLALRDAIGRSPDVALTLLLLKLVTDTFRTSGASVSYLEASVRQVYMSAQANTPCPWMSHATARHGSRQPRTPKRSSLKHFAILHAGSTASLRSNTITSPSTRSSRKGSSSTNIPSPKEGGDSGELPRYLAGRRGRLPCE